MTATELLDGTVHQRTEGVRFDLLDKDDNVLGVLMVDRDDPPTMTNDTTRSVRRTVDNVTVLPRPVGNGDATHFYAEDINPLAHRVRVWWVLSTGDEYSLGIFSWADDSEAVWSWGRPRHGSFADGCADLDQPLAENYGVDFGTDIGSAIATLADLQGIPEARRYIDVTIATAGAPIGWAAGRDTSLKAFESLCALGGFYPVYFDNNGVLTCRAAPDLTSATPDFDFGFGIGNVIIGSAVKSSDILTAPNEYVVVSSNADAEVVGSFSIPDDAPNSYANTGKIRRRTLDVQGLATNADADQAAAAAYAADSSTYTWLTFDTPPDPRHDTFDIVSFEYANYRQLGWTLELKPGGTMRHDCRGIYT